MGCLIVDFYCFQRHILSISSSFVQEEFFREFGDQDVLLRCFNSFFLPCLEYCSPVWSSAVDSHLKLLDMNLLACRFLIPITISLQHCRSTSSLCMLYKIFHNSLHHLHSELPKLFYPQKSHERFLELTVYLFRI